eukprot:1337807-Rhodomonas_salina.1
MLPQYPTSRSTIPCSSTAHRIAVAAYGMPLYPLRYPLTAPSPIPVPVWCYAIVCTKLAYGATSLLNLPESERLFLQVAPYASAVLHTA